jgi:hypothetical protein
MKSGVLSGTFFSGDQIPYQPIRLLSRPRQLYISALRQALYQVLLYPMKVDVNFLTQ